MRRNPGNIARADKLLGKNRTHVNIHSQCAIVLGLALEKLSVKPGATRIISALRGLRWFACAAGARQSAAVTSSVAASCRPLLLPVVCCVGTEISVYGSRQQISAAATSAWSRNQGSQPSAQAALEGTGCTVDPVSGSRETWSWSALWCMLLRAIMYMYVCVDIEIADFRLCWVVLLNNLRHENCTLAIVS